MNNEIEHPCGMNTIATQCEIEPVEMEVLEDDDCPHCGLDGRCEK